jgi:DNA-3-methyladenine glycosylase II
MMMNSIQIHKLDSPEIMHLRANDARLNKLISRYGELRYSLHNDSFAFLVETIIGQMLSSIAADAISERMHRLCDGNLSPMNVLGQKHNDLREIGLSNAKAQYIFALAEHILNRPTYFKSLEQLSDDEVINELTSLKGLGSWSAKMYLIFMLDRKDVLPYEDGAFLQAYKWLYSVNDISVSSIKKTCTCWSPWTSIASRYLYRALDSGYTKNPLQE